MTDGDTAAYDRLRRLIADRRKELGLSVSAAAKRAGFHRATWAAIEKGARQAEDYTYGAVQKALGWAPGSIDAVLHGGDPTVEDDAETKRTIMVDKLERLRRVANDPEHSDAVRAMARAQLDQVDAVLQAAEAEAASRTRSAS